MIALSCFSCTVSTMLDNATDWVSLSVTVNAPVITAATKDLTVFNGDHVVLECKANGIPQPSSYRTYIHTYSYSRMILNN